MDSDILSQALIKLEIPGFFFLLSPDQVLALFSRISESPLSDLRLIELNLWDWDVSLVPPEVFAGALSELETVGFCRLSRVTRFQLEALFMLMFSQQEEAGGSKLKKLVFHHTEQITAILNMLKEIQQGRLKDIRIYSQRFDGPVSTTLLQQAKLNNAVRIVVKMSSISPVIFFSRNKFSSVLPPVCFLYSCL